MDSFPFNSSRSLPPLYSYNLLYSRVRQFHTPWLYHLHIQLYRVVSFAGTEPTYLLLFLSWHTHSFHLPCDYSVVLPCPCTRDKSHKCKVAQSQTPTLLEMANNTKLPSHNRHKSPCLHCVDARQTCPIKKGVQLYVLFFLPFCKSVWGKKKIK
jgi:hypothetical protein